TFVIISGDSDFSPLVSKLRENAKRVIGVGVKQSCSDLLIANCDEFIYYDDLVRDREGHRGGARRENRENVRRSPEEENKRHEKVEERKARAIELAVATFADLIADRGDTERIWASVLKEVIKRRNPGFNESYFGFRSFGNLLEEAANRGLIGFGRDDKSGAYVTRVQNRASHPEETTAAVVAVEPAAEPKAETAAEPHAPAPQGSRRRGGRRSRKETAEHSVETVVVEAAPAAPPEAPIPEVSRPDAAHSEAPSAAAAPAKARRRGGRQPRQETEAAVVPQPEVVAAPPAVNAAPVAEEPKPRKPRSRKPKAAAE